MIALILINMNLGLYAEAAFNWQQNKFEYEGEIVLKHIVYKKVLWQRSFDKEEEVELQELVTKELKAIINGFKAFHQTYYNWCLFALSSVILLYRVSGGIELQENVVGYS